MYFTPFFSHCTTFSVCIQTASACKKGLTATCSATELCVSDHSSHGPLQMYKDDNCTCKTNQDRRGISRSSEHLSYVKQSHLVASLVKMIFCRLLPLLKQGRYKEACKDGRFSIKYSYFRVKRQTFELRCVGYLMGFERPRVKKMFAISNLKLSQILSVVVHCNY